MNSELDWNLVRTFLAICQEGSLSGASRRLGLSQPTIARHLAVLEDSLGVELFVRSQRGLTATEQALELLPLAEVLGATATSFLRKASGPAGEIRGTVRVSASEIISVEHLPSILARLRRQHPQLAVELVASNAVADLLRRDADIAVRNTDPRQEALIAKRLPSAKLGFHASRAYLERCGVPSSLAQLAEFDVIGFDTTTPAMRAMIGDNAGFDRSAFALRTDSNLVQLAAIRAGFGIGICQVGIAAREPDLVRVLAEEIDIDLDIWVVMHEDLRANARCRAVFDALVDGLSQV
ncbi:DNA-binding transcriptional regulator, LysR family [Devosia sp. YR412]|uniref:LysR family transcriptional regulator n=1 Tax=Devosia sp. YR412 TaxID=1881030 RepID=UPI0008C7ACA3|nr:LysR family transcriptional regulator [Devosia sp. YR412]SEP68505.1 DNA-binding transcriptional regulator, LysR family [Devosia sp. YR412]